MVTNPNPSKVADKVLEILRCLSCKDTLRRTQDALACNGCGRNYPVVDNVVRFVDEQHYAGSFGFQWQVFARTQMDHEQSRRSENAFRRRTGYRPEDLAGKLVLDVGCGMGRFAEVATRWGAHVVGIDLSLAAEVAARNLADRQATIFQADALQLPFAPESFDFIYSIGVLHHTPSCEQAFKALPPLLKPNGQIAVWLYSAYNPWYRMSDIYRKVTRRMRPRTLHKLCYIAIPMYRVDQLLRKVPLVGRAVSGVLRLLFPISWNSDPQWRVLDTFDWYSPWYQSKHTYEEVFRWFESSGMVDLHVGEEPISVRGRRPVRREETKLDREEVAQCAE
jgi:2-polyprenyl-3-methyl-5-hydroxy-6-metoxy-1,4-benzoquinol methylase